MDTIVKFVKKNSILISFATCNLLFIVLLAVVGLSDATSDDYGMQMAIFGDRGSKSAFTSIFWSVPIYHLQRIMPRFAWHFFMQIILIIISMNIYLNMLNRIFGGILGKVISVVFTIIVFQSFVQQLNFTQTSAITCTAGFLLFLISYQGRKGIISILETFFGVILVVIGTQLRLEMIYILIVFMCFLLACVIAIKSDLWKRMFKLGGIVLVICIVALVSDSIVKANDSSFDLYVKQNDYLSNIVDYGIMDYDEARVVYDELGLSENDASMICRKSESDPYFFNEELLIIMREKIACKNSITNIVKLIKSGIRVLVSNKIEYFCYGIIGLMLYGKKDKSKLIPIGSIMYILAFLLLFTVMGRLVDRVIVSVVLFATAPVLISLSLEKISFELQGKQERIICMLAIVWIILPMVFLDSIGNRRDKNINHDVQELVKAVENDNEHFFAYSKGLDQAYKAIDNLLLTKDYAMDYNSFSLNVTPTAPFEKAKFDYYGITNIYQDSIDSDVIRYILVDEVQQVQTYIREHYCKSAKLVLVTEIEGFEVYKVVSE